MLARVTAFIAICRHRLPLLPLTLACWSWLVRPRVCCFQSGLFFAFLAATPAVIIGVTFTMSILSILQLSDDPLVDMAFRLAYYAALAGATVFEDMSGEIPVFYLSELPLAAIEPVRCDLDGDGDVNWNDFVELLRLTSDPVDHVAVGDVDNSGTLEIQDSVFFLYELFSSSPFITGVPETPRLSLVPWSSPASADLLSLEPPSPIFDSIVIRIPGLPRDTVCAIQEQLPPQCAIELEALETPPFDPETLRQVRHQNRVALDQPHIAKRQANGGR